MAGKRRNGDRDATARSEFERAESHRRDADLRLSMSERLEQLNELCKQLTAIRGSARRA